jgi:hypothetical protein
MVTLKQIMRANALSCIIFGFLFIVLPTDTALFLSTSNTVPTMMLVILGVVLVANGAHLIWASLSQKPNKILVMYFSLGDFLWVIASSYLIFSEMWITSEQGIAAASTVAVLVGVFGVLQMQKRSSVDIASHAI